jgi:hypothetical protein
VFDAAGVRLLRLFQSLLSAAVVVVDGDDELAVVFEYAFEVFIDIIRQSIAAAKGKDREAELDERIGVLLAFRPEKSLCVASCSGVRYGAVVCRFFPLPALVRRFGKPDTS